jgi:signal transduction histidine kinase
MDTVIEEKRYLELKYFQNSLQLHFQALDFLSDGSNEYRYRLLPYQNDWYYTNSNAVDFAQLPSGDYVFQVQAATKSGSWTHEFASIHISIKPPFWKTIWFAILVLLSILSIIRYFFLQTLNRKLALQQAEFEKKQALDQERNRIAQDMHDDLGSGLSAINLLSNYLKSYTFEPKIDIQINKIAQSSNLLSQRLREIIWTMNNGKEELSHLAEFLRRYILDLDEAHPITLRFRSNIGLEDFIVNKEIQYNILLCVKESINNALKYAKSNQILTTFSISNQQLLITIEDDGIGFDFEKAMSKDGNGLKNIEQRMKSIGGQFRVMNKNGTTISLLYNLATSKA